ncbi:uncharacterized protein LOC127253752 [Andrographis paniculata]|uniref:uncharacterized protein LOC127253752 n=1 Tax=Andrographis paniculata TaxID=175694 RepID=UPI0021E7014F|nr:uncharacterized protein LOC127253752 [Andrographis paniculata]
MAAASAALVAVMLAITAQFAFASTVPAFLWSPHLNELQKIVEYRTLSPRDLAKSVMNQGGWSKYLCSAEEDKESKNFAFLFVGTEPLDIARPTKNDPALLDLLKDSFSNSNFSLAFPYISAEGERVSIEGSMISEFADTCQKNLGVGSIALAGSCFIQGENFERIKDLHSIHDYLNSRIEKITDGRTDLIVLCPEHSPSSQDSDSSTLSQVLNSVHQLGAKYTVLYVSDPFRSMKQLTNRGLERFLAEGAKVNESSEPAFCDGVCQIKSSLLEGLLVGIVLLVILISGLCCMMGIDTPTRFEAPQDT